MMGPKQEHRKTQKTGHDVPKARTQKNAKKRARCAQNRNTEKLKKTGTICTKQEHRKTQKKTSTMCPKQEHQKRKERTRCAQKNDNDAEKNAKNGHDGPKRRT